MAGSRRGRASMQTIDLSTDDDDVELIDSERARRRRPSGLRRFLVRFVLLVVFVAIALLVTTELSIALKMPRLDPRPWLVRGLHWVIEQVRPYLHR